MAFSKSFTKIKVSGQTDVDADLHTDELTFAAGSNVTITTSGDTITFASSGGGGGGDVADDTSPQLGGDLDVNGKALVSASNGDIEITPNGSGDIILDGQKWPQADGSNGQYLSTNGSGQLAWGTVSGGGSSESSVSISLTHDNDCFDLGTSAYTAKTTSLTSISIPSGKTVTAVALETTEAFAQNSGTPSGSAVIKIDDVWYKPKFLAESYGYLSESEYWVRNSATGIYGVVASRQLIGSSAVSPSIQIKQVTNDTANSGGYLTDGTLKLTIYYT